MAAESLDAALKATAHIDADSAAIRDFAAAHAGDGPPREQAIRLYYAVRDAVPYDLRYFGIEEEIFTASHCLASAGSFCVPKALTLAATARAAGIPARIGFADVRNHLASPRILELMGSDVFRWHAYTLLFLDDRWVKATPAFDLGFCAQFGVEPLEFDGQTDSIFHPFDTSGRQHMEYVLDRGAHDDLPFEAFRRDMQDNYPRLIAAMAAERERRAASAQPQTAQEAKP
ncbi:TGc domain-containing protein [Hyphomicrobiales bacterium]|nr:TGc domain-containing protein [Hyphomicrobiales bacterium]CAH1700537.1 TGc domain-containing protein [Hyphomicrobiales bacterium]CAI0344386.1 TGc domain-containing protein [Hyphomicrobiales bacterium]